MSYFNRENNYGETPGAYNHYPSREIYPDSEEQIIAAHRDSASEIPRRNEPPLDDLSTFSTARLFDEIVTRAIEVKDRDVADSLFQYWSQQSERRSQRWMTAREFSVLERAAEMAGEAGEAVNVAKKLLRAQLGMAGNYKPGDTSVEELISKLEYELGDVFITMLNLQNAVPGVDILRGFRRAFNEKSEQLGFPERV